jgi:hypothetical protein
MSATLGVVAATYRATTLSYASALEPTAVDAAAMTWRGTAFAPNGELYVLRRYGLAAFECGENEAAIDYFLTAASLVDAPTDQYRLALRALRAVCADTGRPRAVLLIDRYFEMPLDDALARSVRGDPAAAILFEREQRFGHAAWSLERAGLTSTARARYLAIAASAAPGSLTRGLAALAASRSSAPGAARDRARNAALAATRSALPIASRWDREATSEFLSAIELGEWSPTGNSTADRFRYITAPPWVEPMLDEELAYDTASMCDALLSCRARFTERVSEAASEFALRRVLVAGLLDVEVKMAVGERRRLLGESLALRLQQLGDRRFLPAAVADERAVAA